MTLEDVQKIHDLHGMSECLRWALQATSAAQLQSNEDFDKMDELQEAYNILYKVFLESKEYEEI